jgi:N-acetylmuramoyl-L-alanine amidase
MGRTLIAVVVVAAVSATLPLSAADWSTLERYQRTITRAEFDKLVSQVYAPSGALTNYLTYTGNSVSIFSTPAKTDSLFTLQFAPSQSTINHQPFSIRRVALDPGHIGGEWARTEERFFVRSRDRPVQEAALNLTVARLLRPKLEAAGFTVFLTKDNFEPVTDKRPDDFRAQAERELALAAPLRGAQDEANRADAIRKRAELLFYRNAEIAARARRINEEINPDLTICIHFNAVEWDECRSLVDDNRLVVFIHGNYRPEELAGDDEKFRLFTKLLSRSHETELPVAEALASALAKATGLPPVQYAPGGSAVRVGDNPYVYARNLAANRLYNSPVVYLEPYYMNNRIIYQRIQLGDYAGTREIEGKLYKSIFRQYADAVCEGLRPYLAPRN